MFGVELPVKNPLPLIITGVPPAVVPKLGAIDVIAT